jgi:site-specific DNA-methyltransferase (adenine-specific)
MTPYYQKDGQTIYLGDCRDILPTLGPVDCVVTSPPYNQLGSRIPKKPSGMWGQSGGGSGFSRAVNLNGYPDDIDEGEYQKLQNEIFGLVKRSDLASLFYNHQVRWRNGCILHPIKWFSPEGWVLRQEIIWDRGGGMMMNARMFCRFDERILWMTGDKYIWNQNLVGKGSIWRISREQQQQGKTHPVEFPIEIPTRCIAATSDVGSTVLDPFMGSGTTLRAAKDLGRKAIGIEIHEPYCEIAAKRLEQGVFDFGSEWGG